MFDRFPPGVSGKALVWECLYPGGLRHERWNRANCSFFKADNISDAAAEHHANFDPVNSCHNENETATRTQHSIG